MCHKIQDFLFKVSILLNQPSHQISTDPSRIWWVCGDLIAFSKMCITDVYYWNNQSVTDVFMSFKRLMYPSPEVTLLHAHLLTSLFCLCLVAPYRCEYFRCGQPSPWFCTQGLLCSGFRWTLAGCHISKQNSLAQHKDRLCSSGGTHIKHDITVKG